MTKTEYLNDLLTLCTDSQKNMYNRMYPNGVTGKQVDNAISQIKNTILGLNNKCDKLSSVSLELSTLKIEHEQLKQVNNRLQRDCDVLENEVDRLSNPISTDNAYVQERLAILDALEAGGVDNWDWYGASLEQAGL